MAALIIVDVQNDFLPGGALGVAEGDSIISQINALQQDYELIVASMDWHPANHCSFADNNPGSSIGEILNIDGLSQIMWPAHCVQGSPGASLAASLDIRAITELVHKGMDPHIDSYSGFFDNHRKRETALHEILQKHRESHVGICGLATDYCVLYTALDAVSLGYTVDLHCNAVKGVDLNSGDVEAALQKMRSVGIRLIEG